MEIYYIAIAALSVSSVLAQTSAIQARKRLNTLRANAFITNAKGHRVRYVNATPEEQARAEGN